MNKNLESLLEELQREAELCLEEVKGDFQADLKIESNDKFIAQANVIVERNIAEVRKITDKGLAGTQELCKVIKKRMEETQRWIYVITPARQMFHIANNRQGIPEIGVYLIPVAKETALQIIDHKPTWKISKHDKILLQSLRISRE